jgi:tetratricopeptide (TPR) repeat protein
VEETRTEVRRQTPDHDRQAVANVAGDRGAAPEVQRDKVITSSQYPGIDFEKVQASVALLQDANKKYKDGDYDSARDMMEESLALNPANEQTYRAMARLQRDLGLIDEETQTYRDWISNAPTTATAHYMLANALERSGHYDEAYEEVNRFLALDDRNINRFPMAAGQFQRLDREEDVGRVLQAWKQAAPQSADAYRSMAEYYRRAGDMETAISEYQTAIQLAPGVVSNHRNLAGIYSQEGRYYEAEEQIYKAIDLRPNDMTLQLQLANIYDHSGELESSIATYQHIVDNTPNSQEAHVARNAIVRLERRL